MPTKPTVPKTAPFVWKTDLLTNGSYRARAGGPKDVHCIVLHQTCSGHSDAAKPIRDYFNGLRSPNRVSSHYVVGREKPKAVILQCVPDDLEAYHAGEPSSWGGRAHVNAFSIGIEIVDDGDGKASDSWPDHQIQALAFLLLVEFGAHRLDMSAVTEHHLVLHNGQRSDLTPDFPWKKLRAYVKNPPWKV